MKKTNFFVLLFALTISLISSCSKDSEENEMSNKNFSKLSSEHTGINFQNNLKENDSLNYFSYSYLYMGGGVAAGDIDNDGLTDLFFTGNMESNRLYLNQGDLQFKDITKEAGVGGDSRWFTGVTMVDINNDGYLDIYVSASGKFERKHCRLYYHLC